MNSPEAIQAAVECIKDNIGQNRYKIYNIVWEEGAKLENKMVKLSVEMINSNSTLWGDEQSACRVGILIRRSRMS